MNRPHRDDLFGKDSQHIQQGPARAWGNDALVGRLSHVVLTVDGRASHKWRRQSNPSGVKRLVKNIRSKSSKAWKVCFRPCSSDVDPEGENAMLLENGESNEVLKVSVPNLFNDGSSRLQERAVGALLHLSGIYGNPLKIVSFPRALEGIVRLLAKENEPNLQRLATLTLGNLALRQVNSVASVAIEGLASLLADKKGARDLEAAIELQEEAASVLANICYDAEGGRIILNSRSGALTGLVNLLFRDDRRGAQEEATRALVNLALVQENAQKLLELCSVSIIGGLVGLLGEFDRPLLLDNATRSLASLSYAPENASRIVESDQFNRALEALVEIVMRRQARDMGMLDLAVMTLANLSVSSTVQIQIADYPNLLEELRWCVTSRKDKGVVEHTAMALGNLAIAEENRPKIARQEGMLRGLVDVMADKTHPGGQEHAAYALANLSHAHEWNQLKIADVPGVMEGLVYLLSMKNNPSAQQQAARLLANLSYPQENSSKIITYPGAVNGLTALLEEHDNVMLQRDVTNAFANLTYPQENRWISSFCIQGLARVMVVYSNRRNSTGTSVKITEISDSVSNFENRFLQPVPEHTTSHGNGCRIVEVDQDEMMEIRMLDVAIEGVKNEQSVGALENHTPSRKDEVKETGSRSTKRVTFLDGDNVKTWRLNQTERQDSLDPEVKIVDVVSIKSAASCPKIETPGRATNSSLTFSHSVNKKGTSIETPLENQARGYQERHVGFSDTGLEMEQRAVHGSQSVLESQTVPAEKYKLDCERRGKASVEDSVLEQAAIALGNLAIYKENKRIIGECDEALSGLVGLLPRYDNPDVQENAAWALANLFQADDGTDGSQTVAKQRGVMAIQPLGDLLLKNDTPTVQEQAARALANLAYFPENRAEIVKLPRTLTGVVSLMSVDEHPEIQEKAVRLLTNLSCGKEYMPTIAEHPGVVPGLSGLLAKEQNPEIQRTAAMCLSNLALAPENISALVESPSAMSNVLELLSSDQTPAVQEQAAKFIEHVAAQDVNHQLKISEFPKIFPELEKFLFQDENSVVQEQAIKALVNLARTQENRKRVLEEPEALTGITRMLLKDDNSVTQLNAALVLKNLSLDLCNIQKIVDYPNILATLMKLMSRHGDQVQEAAVLTLLNLSRLRSTAIVIAKYAYPKTLRELATLLRIGQNKVVVESTTMILTNLANCTEIRPLILEVPEVAKALERILSDCAMEQQLLMARMARVMTPGRESNHANESALSAQDLKGQRTGTGFWAATALTLIDCSRARALPSYSGEALKGRANALIWMGMLKEAIEDLDVSVSLQPEAPATFSLRAIAKSLLGDYEGALTDANRGIEQDPHYGGWHQERGILKRLLGDLQGALTDLNRAVELQGEDYEMLKHRAYVRYLMQDEEGARRDAESAQKFKGSSATLFESQSPDSVISFLGAQPVEFLHYELK